MGDVINFDAEMRRREREFCEWAADALRVVDEFRELLPYLPNETVELVLRDCLAVLGTEVSEAFVCDRGLLDDVVEAAASLRDAVVMTRDRLPAGVADALDHLSHAVENLFTLS